MLPDDARQKLGSRRNGKPRPARPFPKRKKPLFTLVGRCFHSRDAEGKIKWQGHVIGSPKRGLYLIQLYEWILGRPSIQRFVRIEEMESWFFYSDHEEMNYSAEHGTARPGGPYSRLSERGR